MKKLLLSAVATATVLGATSGAFASDEGWYVRAGAGYGSLESSTLTGALNGKVNAKGER